MCVRVSVYLLRLPYCLSSFCTLSLLVHHHTCLSQVPSLSLFFFLLSCYRTAPLSSTADFVALIETTFFSEQA
jgi:hypothetical protein